MAFTTPRGFPGATVFRGRAIFGAELPQCRRQKQFKFETKGDLAHFPFTQRSARNWNCVLRFHV
jgi:hypothetical protein